MQILVLFGILLVMALVSSVGAAIWNIEHTEESCWYLSRAGENPDTYHISQLETKWIIRNNAQFEDQWLSEYCVFVQVTSPLTLPTTCWHSSSCTTTWSPSACWSLWRWSSSHRPSSSTGYVCFFVIHIAVLMYVLKYSWSLCLCFVFPLRT